MDKTEFLHVLDKTDEVEMTTPVEVELEDGSIVKAKPALHKNDSTPVTAKDIATSPLIPTGVDTKSFNTKIRFKQDKYTHSQYQARRRKKTKERRRNRKNKN